MCSHVCLVIATLEKEQALVFFTWQTIVGVWEGGGASFCDCCLRSIGRCLFVAQL